ncbi:MAG: hypothetical protein WA777_11385 [Rhodanobacter sp.]
MTRSRCVVLVGGFCAMVLSTSLAHAAGGGTIGGGTITFVGAILAPTCNIATVPDSLTAVAGEAVAPTSHRQICSGPGGDAANMARAYALNVVRLTSTESDPVLKYFDNYVKAGDPTAKDPVLVTQTYE